MTYATSIPTAVVGKDIPTKLVGTVYFDKSCEGDSPYPQQEYAELVKIETL